MDTLFVVTHVPPIVKLPALYRYIGVAGLSGKDLLTDLTGDSIAPLNYTFCELTSLYWIWKNYRQSPEDLIGLVHYRRLFFDGKILKAFFKKPLSEAFIRQTMQKCDLLIAAPMPLMPNIYLHYKDCHLLSDLDTALCIAERRDGVPAGHYKKVLENLNFGHMFNMFICSRKIMDSYCEWVFPILFQTFAELSLLIRNSYQLRAMGFLAERLFNLWIFLNLNYKIKFSPVLYLHKSRFSEVNRIRKN